MAKAPDDPSFLARLQGFLASPNTRDLGLSLLANSGYSSTPRTFGEVAGQSALAAQQMGMQRQKLQQDQAEADLMKRYREAQIAALQAKPTVDQPSSVKEYEFAKQNGFKGSFQDWVTAGGQSSRPSSVQEWEFFSKLAPDVQQRYLEMKRNPNFFVKDVNSVPTVIRPTVGAGTTVNPLSTKESEAEAQALIARLKSYGAGVGEGQAKIDTGIQTKGSNAVGTVATLDLAEPLIDVATGSAAGAARDKVAAVFGGAPDSAQAIAQLKVLQANLMTSMPRMEGPQSDRDVDLYRQAAGQIGDPTVPAGIKKAAVKTIRDLQDKYKERAGISTTTSTTPSKSSGWGQATVVKP